MMQPWHGAELVKQLLTFSRRQTLRPELLDFNELLRGFLAVLARTIPESIRIGMELSEASCMVRVDRTQLEAVILNLTINSRDAIGEGGHIRVETAVELIAEGARIDEVGVAAGEYVVARISDDGCGIQDDALARVFEPFFTTKGPGEGSGLGLSMVYGFVKQSGGYIFVRSENRNGTSVDVYLPRQPAVASPITTPVPASAPTTRPPLTVGSEQVLLVEDDTGVRKVTVRMLKGLGYIVTEVADSSSALAQLERRSDFALLLTDIVLAGDMRGDELAERALAMHPTLKVLFVSGYPRDVIQQGNSRGRDAKLLAKPFSPEDLAVTVRAALDG
jgi:CheY-like chemotaxis protein